MDTDILTPAPILMASLIPAPSGFGLYQLTPWEADEFCPDADCLDDYASDAGYKRSEGPGEQYAGLIQGESDADGWLIPTEPKADDDDPPHPIAWRQA